MNRGKIRAGEADKVEEKANNMDDDLPTFASTIMHFFFYRHSNFFYT